jgi:N-methylhydantoinase B
LSKATKTVDPLTKAVVSNAFVHIANEGVDVLDKTAISPILNEAQDRCLAITDAKARLISMCESGLPLHVASGEFPIKAAIDKFGSDFQPGDVILQNDPYTGGGNHLPDWTFIIPIFVENKLSFFTMVRGHQQDTKGAYPGGYFPDGYDVQSEGLLIPPTKVFRKGEKQEVYDFILHNVRWPEIVRIDNLAMIGGLTKVEQRVIELCKRYGRTTVLTCIDSVITDTEKAVRAQIRQWPEGTYEGESLVDRDGSGHESPTVRVAVTIKGDEITVDFSKTDKQVSFVNTPFATTYAMTLLAVIPRFDPNSPINHGKIAPVRVVAPKGTIVNPEYPATIGACAVFCGNTIIEAIQMALGKAIPDKVDEMWAPSMEFLAFGHDPRTNEPYWMLNFQNDGGTGAIEGADGIHGASLASGGGLMRSLPVEIAEIQFPWHTLKWELVTDSAGAGKYRGGLGTLFVTRNEGSDATVETGASSGENHAPFGQKGGKGGTRARIWVIRDGKEERVPTMALFPGKAGEVFGSIASGGGGHGDPFERPIEKVREDVRNEFVSLERARRDYGVVIDPGTFEVDIEATSKLRGK